MSVSTFQHQEDTIQAGCLSQFDPYGFFAWCPLSTHIYWWGKKPTGLIFGGVIYFVFTSTPGDHSCDSGLCCLLYMWHPSISAAPFGGRCYTHTLGLTVSDWSSQYGFVHPFVLFWCIAGTVFVDGNEMKTKLPPIKKGTTLTFQTEMLPNGKVRVSVQVDDKEVTLDWKANSSNAVGFGPVQMMQPPAPAFYFALRFAQEHWKVGVE